MINQSNSQVIFVFYICVVIKVLELLLEPSLCHLSFSSNIGQRCLSSYIDIDIVSNLAFSDIYPSLDVIENCPLQLLPPYVIQKLDTIVLGYLRTSYQLFLPEVDPLEIPRLYEKHRNIQWLWEQLNTTTPK